MSTANARERWHSTFVCLALILTTLAFYWPVSHFDFITLDDPDYVTNNAEVIGGLTWHGILWAFSASHSSNWHPLTWISHMLDVQAFGLSAGAHHLTNVIFHIANTVLLFLLLRRTTGASWRSGFVAALFALHPLHIESVAWVSERKDVLSTFFGLLSLTAYCGYVGLRRKDSEGRPARDGLRSEKKRSVALYCTALTLFACSLMSKPMLVTLPLLLLLLDYWPLRRFTPRANAESGSTRRIILEKLPFLALSLVSAAITLHVQKVAIASFESAPLASRIANIPMGYLSYVAKSFWPHPLAVFYPYRHVWNGAAVGVAAGLLIGISVFAIWSLRRRPWIIVGWLWFTGMLVPVIGIVQAGGQAIADRYTYLPLVGLWIALVWTVCDVESFALPRPALAFIGCGLLLVCLAIGWAQLAVWRNTQALCLHALRVTENNALAHATLAEDLANRNQFEAAKQHFELALAANPDFRFARVELGRMLLSLARPQQAETTLKEALLSDPKDLEAHRLLVAAYAAQKQPVEVRAQLDTMCRLAPEKPELANNLAWLLATDPDPALRDGARAVSLSERACQLTGGTNIWLLSTLAAAYAEAGRFEEAVNVQQKVCGLAANHTSRAVSGDTNVPRANPRQPVGNLQVLNSTEARLELYRNRQPYRETN